MSIHARLAGTDGEKLPVWGVITDFTRVLDQDPSMGFSDFAAKYSLSPAEQVQAGQILTKIGEMVTSRSLARIAIGFSVEDATEDARAIVHSKVEHALLRSELGTNTEAEFLAVFGL